MQPEYVKINLHGLKCLNSKWNKLFFNTEFIVPQDIQIMLYYSQYLLTILTNIYMYTYI